MTKLVRPPFALAHPGDLAGCGRHRILRPLEIMGRSGFMAGRAEMQFLPDHILKAINPSIVVWQRQSEDNQIEIMKRYRAALPDAFFVYEIDDALSAVPDKSWHKPYMTPNIDAKTRRAVAICDVVTVTTEDLRDHMASICEPGTKIRVVPNMLGRDDLELAEQMRKESDLTSTDGKLRVGWGGGIGHSGDLALLNEAFAALNDHVEWVFLGMDPETPLGTNKVFAGAAPPERYLPSLAALNVDLIVAPLEDNLFNRCKSNLRLVEAGACFYPVIASPVAPYHTDSPPVFAYADGGQEWIDAILRFKALTSDERKRHGINMREWVASRYVMDSQIEKRLLGWLPERTRLFHPRLDAASTGLTVVSSANIEGIDTEKDLAHACINGSNDVLYVRPNAVINDDIVKRLRAASGDVICPLSNDAGPWGFPDPTRFTSLDNDSIKQLDEICHNMPDTGLIDLIAISGPVVLLRRKAIAAIGCPDFESFDSPELALLEWSVTAKARGLVTGLYPHAFVGVPVANTPPGKEAETCSLRITHRWPQNKTDEPRLKALREHIELVFHREHYKTLPPQQRNDYTVWADTCDTHGPRLIDAAWDWEEANGGPEIQPYSYPEHVTNSDLPEWLFFAPEKSQTAPDWLAIAHETLQRHPEAKILYADHDHFSADNKRIAPDFKPNLDVQMLLARDYISQCVFIHRDLIDEDFTADEDTLYALALKAITQHGRESIVHIPRILTTLQPYTMVEATRLAGEKLAAAQEFCEVNNYSTIKLSQHPQYPLLRSISYQPHDDPSVAIIVPTKNNLELLAPCIASILTMTTHGNYHIFIVNNGSTREGHLAYLKSLTDPRVTVLDWPEEYNWATLNNWAVAKANLSDKDFDFFCFLNDDTRVMSGHWLSEMIGAAQVSNTGSVGARLVYPHGLIQHVGVAAHRGMTGHIHKGLQANHPGTNFYASISHEATCATGACLLVRADIFKDLNGFDERFAHNFNDVAFGVELNRRGYYTIIANNAELQHLEGVTRNSNGFNAESYGWLVREGKLLHEFYPDDDPYWNPNLLFTMVEGGSMVSGMDLATYEFPAPALPWQPDSYERILVVGDPAPAAIDRHNGSTIYRLDIHGNTARLSHPPMANCGPWDIRRPEIAAKALETLNLDKIVFTSLNEAPLQTLAFIQRLNIPIIYRPANAESVCPRGTLSIDEESCNRGYCRQQCQSCLDTHSSPYGHVSVAGWLSAWLRFFASDVTVDLMALEKQEYREALEFVYARQEALEAAE